MNGKNIKSFFKNKKITLMGLGLLGRGIGDARFLAERGASLLVTDLKSKKELAPALAALKKYKNIHYTLGEHRLEDFRGRDMIMKAAGVRDDSPYLALARSHGTPVKMSTSLFAELSPATLVGVTGTRGKSTTAHLIYQIFKNAHKDKKEKVYLGGNIRGVSTIEFLPKVEKGDIVVLELDSWQLQGFGEANISPHVAVFTTLMRDHMNYYKNSMSRYFKDKANIYKFQKSTDVLIAGRQVSSRIRFSRGKKIIADAETVPKSWHVAIPGEHNRYNIGLAIAAARAMRVPEMVIKETVESFSGMGGRLELVKTLKNGVKIYNDTTSTTPDALIAALKALGVHKNIVLIMGGADKTLSLQNIFLPIKKYAKTVICLPGSGTEKIMKNKKFIKFSPERVRDMREAVKKAVLSAQKCDTILLSPGFASFGIFKNEFDRGEQFDAIVKKLA